MLQISVILLDQSVNYIIFTSFLKIYPIIKAKNTTLNENKYK